MRFNTRRHRFYRGIDLHARSMYVCILDQEGKVVAPRNLRAESEPFLEIIPMPELSHGRPRQRG